jgi:GNAT superfamily N-acetyltransferase
MIDSNKSTVGRLMESFKRSMLAEEEEGFTWEDITKELGKHGIESEMYAQDQLMRGVEVEMEHGSKMDNMGDTNVTKDRLWPTMQIAIAHLKENPKYYTYLDQMEAQWNKDSGALKEAFGRAHMGDKSFNELKSDLQSQHPNVELWMHFSAPSKILELSKIVVPEEERSQGVGASIMSVITKWADENYVSVALTPSKDFGGDPSRLKEFYGAFGFVFNKGRHKNFQTRETMIRPPQKGGVME